jgi:hypothetical protein
MATVVAASSNRFTEFGKPACGPVAASVADIITDTAGRDPMPSKKASLAAMVTSPVSGRGLEMDQPAAAG